MILSAGESSIMPKTVIPAGYRPALGLYDTQKAIGLIKQIFLEKLCGALHLKRVTAPLFVDPATGLNDDLNGVERPVTFDVPALGANAVSRHSRTRSSAGNCHFSSSSVPHTASTIFCTVCFRYSVVRSSRVMTFSQSHWST